MPDITMKRERTDRWTRMRLSRARSSGTAASCHMLSSVGCISTTSASEFSVHTGSRLGTALGLHCLREAPADAARSVRQFNRLPPVRGTDAKPAVAHLVIVNARIIELHRQAQTSRRKASNRGQHIVGSDHPIVLRGYEVDAGV